MHRILAKVFTWTSSDRFLLLLVAGPTTLASLTITPVGEKLFLSRQSLRRLKHSRTSKLYLNDNWIASLSGSAPIEEENLCLQSLPRISSPRGSSTTRHYLALRSRMDVLNAGTVLSWKRLCACYITPALPTVSGGLPSVVRYTSTTVNHFVALNGAAP